MEDLSALVRSVWTLLDPASPTRERILELARQAHHNGQGDQDGETPPLVDRTIKSWDSPEAAAWILAIGQATWPGRDAIPTAFPVADDAEPADPVVSKPADPADSEPADPAVSEIVLRTYVDALSAKQRWEIGQYIGMWERQCQHAPVESQGTDRFADDGLYEGEMAIVWGGAQIRRSHAVNGASVPRVDQRMGKRRAWIADGLNSRTRRCLSHGQLQEPAL